MRTSPIIVSAALPMISKTSRNSWPRSSRLKVARAHQCETVTVPPSFPSLVGQGWSVHKRPIFATRVAGHVAGREVRDALYAYTLYEYELVFNALSASSTQFATLGAGSLQVLMGFSCRCRASSALSSTRSERCCGDRPVVRQRRRCDATFTFVRSLGGFAEPVGWVTGTPTIYLVASPRRAGYTITTPKTLTFASAPASGVGVTADFTYAFQCRFLDDALDFENFMQHLGREVGEVPQRETVRDWASGTRKPDRLHRNADALDKR